MDTSNIVSIGYIYEWVYNVNGKFLSKKERIDSRFIIESAPIFLDDKLIWKTSKGHADILFWISGGYIRLYSQHSLNVKTLF